MDPDVGLVRGLCHIPPGSYLIQDVDEEVFLLYTDLAAKTINASSDDPGNFRGLGSVDSRQGTLTIRFDLDNAEDPKSALSDPEVVHRKRRGKERRVKHKTRGSSSFEIQIFQDTTALRTRKGDTGSVIWRASVGLACFLLEQHAQRRSNALLNPNLLGGAHILELGAGTGTLGIALSRLARQYTITDIDELLPLIRKNLDLNFPGRSIPRSHNSQAQIAPGANVKIEALDWMHLHNSTPTLRRSVYLYDPPVDLLLVVDCIYHPSLLPPLITTIDFLSIPERTVVLVVVELRAEDVIREFLELWLAASGKGAWEVWHVNQLMEGPYAVWVGWKRLN